MPSFSLSVRHFVQKGEHLLYLDQIKFGCAHHSCSIFLTFVSSVSLWSNSDVLIVNGLLMLFHFFVMFFHSFINIPSWNSAFSWDYPSPLVIWIRVSHFSFSCVSEHNEVHSIPKEGYFCISSWIVCFFCSISHLIFGFHLYDHFFRNLHFLYFMFFIFIFFPPSSTALIISGHILPSCPSFLTSFFYLIHVHLCYKPFSLTVHQFLILIGCSMCQS